MVTGHLVRLNRAARDGPAMSPTVKMKLLIGVLYCTLTHSTAKAQSSTEAWEGTRWGMSKEDITKVYPGARDFSAPTKEHPDSREFGLQFWDVLGCVVDVDFEVGAEGLERVFINLQVSMGGELLPDAQLRKCAKQFQSAIQEKYGLPIRSEKQQNVIKLEWAHDQAKIEYLEFDFPGMSPNVNIEYSGPPPRIGHGL